MKIRAFLTVVLCAALAACTGNSGREDDPATTSTPPATMTGIVTEIESEGLNEVSSFKLKVDDNVYDILIDEDVTYGFPLGHLEEHRVGALPVTVRIEERNGELYARSIEDA